MCRRCVIKKVIIMKLWLTDKLNIEPELKKRCAGCFEKNEDKICMLADELLGGNGRQLKHCDDLVRLAVVIRAAEKTFLKYKAAGIDEHIFYNTFDDIRIWCEENENRGLKNYGWLKNHVRFELFKIGRLQYQLFTVGIAAHPDAPFKKGDRLLYVHIPSGERLEKEKCIASLHEAEKFFEKYFPQFNYKYFFTESWLLYKGNLEFMKKDSNIVLFREMFDVYCNLPIEAQTYERIFGLSRPPLLRSAVKRLPEDTSLRAAAKAYKLSGGKFGVGCGVVKEKYMLKK